MSRIDLPAGTTAWMNTSGSENLPVEPEGEKPRLGFVPCRDVVVSTASQHLYCADDFGSVFEQDVSTGARTPRLFDRQTGVTGPLTLTLDQNNSWPRATATRRWHCGSSTGAADPALIASEVGSVATFGYNSTASLLNTSEELYDPSLWDPVTGEMTDPLDAVVIGTWADAPDRFWAAFIEPPWAYRCRTWLRVVCTTPRRRPGFRVFASNSKTTGLTFRGTTPPITACCCSPQTTSGCSINSGTTSARPS